MSPTITAFENSPDRGQGLARDMPVRWALEEAGMAYDVRLVSFDAMKQAGHRAIQPFGQIPSYEENGLVLFESGAIVLHVAQRSVRLLPGDANMRARSVTWMVCALSTVEPPIVERETATFAERGKNWQKEHLALAEQRIRTRLEDLSRYLGDGDWLEGSFSAGDLMMVSVLRRLKGSGILEDHPNLSAYVARGETRPAFGRAFAAQLAVFAAGSKG